MLISGNSSSNDTCIVLGRTQTFMSRFLNVPQNPNQVTTKTPKLSGRVLTAAENLTAIKEVEEKKQKKKREKEEKKRIREEKKLQKQKKKAGMCL